MLVNVQVEKPPDPEPSLFLIMTWELSYSTRLLPLYLHKSDRLLGNKINIHAHDMIWWRVVETSTDTWTPTNINVSLICRKRPPPAFHPAGWAEHHSFVTHFSIQVRKLFHTRCCYSHLRLSSGEHQKLESSCLTFIRQEQENVLYQFSASLYFKRHLCGLVPWCSSSSLTSRSPTCALYKAHRI